MSRRLEHYRVIDRGLHHEITKLQFNQYLSDGFIVRSANKFHLGFIVDGYRAKLDPSTGKLVFTYHGPEVDINDPQFRQNTSPKLLSSVILKGPFNSWRVPVKRAEDFKRTVPVTYVAPSISCDVHIVRDNRKFAEVLVRGQLESAEVN